MRYCYVEKSDVRKWQIATLKIQQELQEIIEKARIDVWCGGGTLLGAIRHNGFIYWDTDLDMFFLFKDYKRILIALWEKRFLKEHKLFYYRDSHWQPHPYLNRILSSDLLKEELLDFDMEFFSKGMFKVFSNDGVDIKLYTEDFGKPEEYIKIKHFAKLHLTRYRLAYKNDDIENSKIYTVMPNVCMLPMLRLTPTNYIISICYYLFKEVFQKLHTALCFYESKLEKINDNDFHYTIFSGIKKDDFATSLEDTLGFKFKQLLKNIKQAIFHTIRVWRRIKKDNLSGILIGYKSQGFRMIVPPFVQEDVFPLKKIFFEDVKINVPQEYDKVLHTQFGNYMEIPDIENRFAYPFFIKERI